MGKPAARIGDSHDCPVITLTPHIIGKIICSDNRNVLIGGLPAALRGDATSCKGPPNIIITGSSSVLMLGQPAARKGDVCAHGGTISMGCVTVLIGGIRKNILKKKSRFPIGDRRVKIINHAIQEAIELLKKKLKLLRTNDAVTVREFNKWFGTIDHRSKILIVQRIKKALKLMKKLNVTHFRIIGHNESRQSKVAWVVAHDRTHTIYLGDPFWLVERKYNFSRACVLAHELSHFKNIGKTEDHACCEMDCLSLATENSEAALYNAESFEYFIIS